MSIDPRWLEHPWPSIQAASQMIAERSRERTLAADMQERLELRLAA